MGFLIVDTSGLDLLRARLVLAQQELPDAVYASLDELGGEIIDELAAAAPEGSGEGPPPPGDEEGHLADSFISEVSSQGVGATLVITTTQPTKLRYVVEGRGDVYPVRAKALYWAGLDHPVKRAGPSEPNDFVTPVIEEGMAMADEILAENILECLSILEE